MGGSYDTTQQQKHLGWWLHFEALNFLCLFFLLFFGSLFLIVPGGFHPLCSVRGFDIWGICFDDGRVVRTCNGLSLGLYLPKPLAVS